MKKQKDKEHYDFIKYVTNERWSSYYFQIVEILKTNSSNILEVGPGLNIIKKILQENGLKYYSSDISTDFFPDYTQCISEMDINKKFDVVCAFQVLEHLPFNKFEQSLINLKKHTNKFVIISLPDRRPIFLLRCKVPFIKLINIHWKFPYYRKIVFKGEHYWEIGGKDTKPFNVINIIKKHFLIINKYHIPTNPYHYLFVLKIKEV